MRDTDRLATSRFQVFETIRTPGHFYLVEESLRSSVTLEAFVSSSPGGVLPLPVVWSILEQLSSVVRSLHEPLRVVHRDIKPENILVRVIPPAPSRPPNTPPTVLLKLLDFGLATHYSASEAKLTTCCGSPAYHSPELWRGLREPSGTVPYWASRLSPYRYDVVNDADSLRTRRVPKSTSGASGSLSFARYRLRSIPSGRLTLRFKPYQTRLSTHCSPSRARRCGKSCQDFSTCLARSG